eukprot:gene25920-31729_t
MARSSSDNDSTSSSDSDTDSSTSSEVRRARRRDSVKKRKEKTKKDGKLKELKESRKRKKGHKLHHKEKDKKKSQKHKRHKKSKHSEPSENIQDTLGRTTDGVDAQGQSVLSSASRVSKQAEAVANDNASWKKQVMEAAAAAEERLTSGTYDAQLKEMDATHNAYGGGAVDWRARKRVKKERQVGGKVLGSVGLQVGGKVLGSVCFHLGVSRGGGRYSENLWSEVVCSFPGFLEVLVTPRVKVTVVVQGRPSAPREKVTVVVQGRPSAPREEAQKRMVDLGKQLIAKETAEMERMQSFLSA